MGVWIKGMGSVCEVLDGRIVSLEWGSKKHGGVFVEVREVVGC